MGEVDDAPTARRIALMLGERPMWWSPEKDAGTKMQVSQVRGAKQVTYHSATSHYGSALDHTRPEGVDQVSVSFSSVPC